jgi:hypothetical protein
VASAEIMVAPETKAPGAKAKPKNNKAEGAGEAG